VSEATFTIRAAIPSDAQALVTVMSKINRETSFLVLDEHGLALNPDTLANNLAAIYTSDNNCLFLALLDEQIIGMASVAAASQARIEHVGEVGISLVKAYWGYGLGTVLLEEILQWAQASSIIRRLELKVQCHNHRAIHLYEKMGFKTEAILSRGAKTDQGTFLDVQLMSLLID